MTHILNRLRADAYRLSLRELLEERDEAAREIERLMHELERRKPGPPTPPQLVPAREKSTVRPKVRLVEPSLLRLSEVCQVVGLSRSTIYASIALGRFLRPVKVGVRSVRWRVEAVRDWIGPSPTDHPVRDHRRVDRNR